MIENNEQLAATLDYIAKWADILEGMRAYEVEKNAGVFPITAAGPLGEIRTNLELARDYVHQKKVPESQAATNGAKGKQNDFATIRIPAVTADI